MSDIQFAKGVSVKKKEFSNGGFILKVGINMAVFYEENPTNERGFLNLDFKESKKGNWYAEVNTYNAKPKQENKPDSNDDIVEFGDIDDEEIPF